MAVQEVKFAILTFLLYTFLVLYIFFNQQLFPLIQWIISLKVLVGLFITLLLFYLPYSQVTRRSALLGFVFSTGILFNIDEYYVSFQYLGWYLCALSFFHLSEYIMTALYNADKLSVDSFLLNHSSEYIIAAVASWIEYAIELYLFPVIKKQFFLSFVGLSMVIFGEVIRKLAMVTAKSNFTHLVQFTKREQHVLVTWGLYSWCRHPGYVGWFYWSIGTQIILCNPICFIAYVLASWQFFKDRIWDEELSLVEFFGQDYLNYQNKVGTGLPFIDGFKLDDIDKTK